MVTLSKIFSRCFWGLIVALIFLKKSFDPKNFLRSLITPFENMTSQLTKSFQTSLFETQQKETLVNLCKELASENASLKLQLQQNFDLQSRLTALEDLTKIGQNLPHKKIFARVIRRNPSAWSESVTLNKGKAHGVKENATIITSFGIVGKITEIFEHFSIVTLTSSPKFRLAVCLENVRMPMIFSGNGSSYKHNSSRIYEWKASGTLKNIPIHAQPLEKGTRIISFSLTSDVPNGLTVGYIDAVHSTLDGMLLTADIVLPQELSDFTEVIILTPDDL